MWRPMSWVERAVCVASDLTSLATTAKPLPASPARAASIVAFSASRLVLPAISLIISTTAPIRATCPFNASIVARVSWPAVTARPATSADWLTWSPISADRRGEHIGGLSHGLRRCQGLLPRQSWQCRRNARSASRSRSSPSRSLPSRRFARAPTPVPGPLRPRWRPPWRASAIRVSSRPVVLSASRTWRPRLDHMRP